LLNSIASGVSRVLAISCKTLGCIPSGPGDLSTFKLASFLCTSAGFMFSIVCVLIPLNSGKGSELSLTKTDLKNSDSSLAVFVSVCVS